MEVIWILLLTLLAKIQEKQTFSFQMFHGSIFQELLLKRAVDAKKLEKIGNALAKRHSLTKDFSNFDRLFVEYTNMVKTFNDHHKKYNVTAFCLPEQMGRKGLTLEPIILVASKQCQF